MLIARLGMRREVALYCELNAPLMSRRRCSGLGLLRLPSLARTCWLVSGPSFFCVHESTQRLSRAGLGLLPPPAVLARWSLQSRSEKVLSIL